MGTNVYAKVRGRRGCRLHWDFWIDASCWKVAFAPWQASGLPQSSSSATVRTRKATLVRANAGIHHMRGSAQVCPDPRR